MDTEGAGPTGRAQRGAEGAQAHAPAVQDPAPAPRACALSREGVAGPAAPGAGAAALAAVVPAHAPPPPAAAGAPPSPAALRAATVVGVPSENLLRRSARVAARSAAGAAAGRQPPAPSAGLEPGPPAAAAEPAAAAGGAGLAAGPLAAPAARHGPRAQSVAGSAAARRAAQAQATMGNLLAAGGHGPGALMPPPPPPPPPPAPAQPAPVAQPPAPRAPSRAGSQPAGASAALAALVYAGYTLEDAQDYVRHLGRGPLRRQAPGQAEAGAPGASAQCAAAPPAPASAMLSSRTSADPDYEPSFATGSDFTSLVSQPRSTLTDRWLANAAVDAAPPEPRAVGVHPAARQAPAAPRPVGGQPLSGPGTESSIGRRSRRRRRHRRRDPDSPSASTFVSIATRAQSLQVPPAAPPQEDRWVTLHESTLRAIMGAPPSAPLAAAQAAPPPQPLPPPSAPSSVVLLPTASPAPAAAVAPPAAAPLAPAAPVQIAEYKGPKWDGGYTTFSQALFYVTNHIAVKYPGMSDTTTREGRAAAPHVPAVVRSLAVGLLEPGTHVARVAVARTDKWLRQHEADFVALQLKARAGQQSLVPPEAAHEPYRGLDLWGRGGARLLDNVAIVWLHALREATAPPLAQRFRAIQQFEPEPQESPMEALGRLQDLVADVPEGQRTRAQAQGEQALLAALAPPGSMLAKAVDEHTLRLRLEDPYSMPTTTEQVQWIEQLQAGPFLLFGGSA